jgi:hypothetical protein
VTPVFTRWLSLSSVLTIALAVPGLAQDSTGLTYPDTSLPGVANSENNCVALSPWGRAHHLPEFDAYKVTDTVASGPPAPVRLNNRIARLYRTVIRNGAKNPPDFAGHFTVVIWPNGTFPQFVIVDARTGQVYYDENVTFGLPFAPMYRRDSRLFIIDATSMFPYHRDHPAYPWVEYIEWTGARFKSWRIKVPVGCVPLAR